MQKHKSKSPSALSSILPLVRGMLLVVFFGLSLSAAYVALPPFFTTSYNPGEGIAEVLGTPPADAEVPVAEHLPTPEPLKAIYMTQCVVGTPYFRDRLVSLIEETELNAVVIDIKDYTGKLSFATDNPLLSKSVSDACGASDMQGFIKHLHEKDVYVIGRITVFQDPYYTKLRPDLSVMKASATSTVWQDYKGLSFIDPGAREFWDYIIAISTEAYAIGFDELNFDYIRFPSDGPMQDIYFPWSGVRSKPIVLEEFFTYLHDTLSSTGAKLSADLFGMTTTNTDDLNIGQVLERALPHFDYIAPMVYPSHYPPKFHGFDNPNRYPYEVVKFSMDEAVKRLAATTTKVMFAEAQAVSTTTPYLYEKVSYDIAKLRPWLQDFDYGGNYDAVEVRAQIQAVYDAGLTSWMLWAPSNIYTRGALLSE